MKYHCPRSKRSKEPLVSLHVTVHTDSLIDSQSSESHLVRGLLALHRDSLVQICAVPTMRSSVPTMFRGVPSLQYRSGWQGTMLSGEFTVLSPDRQTLAFMPWTAQDVADVWGFEVGSTDNQQVLRCLKDIKAHEAQDGQVFVTEDARVLRRREWIEARNEVWILSVPETLDYVDVFLKSRGKHLVAPGRQMGSQLYYWTRLMQLVPALSRAWTTSLVLESSVPHGSEIKKHLQSFSDRVITMLKAKDLIASQFYREANNHTLREILYHLNYFMMLVTGTFDSLAWICTYLFDFQGKGKTDVTLRKKAKQRLLGHLSKVEPELGHFLKTAEVQSLLEVFYPARDSIQHRHMLRGLQFAPEKPPSDRQYSLVVLDEETATAIDAKDQDDPTDYVSTWGVRRVSAAHVFLEPYKFVISSLKNLIPFYQTLLSALHLESRYPSSPESIAMIDAIDRKREYADFVIPFLLTTANPTLPSDISDRLRSPSRVTEPALSIESMALYGEHEFFMDLS